MKDYPLIIKTMVNKFPPKYRQDLKQELFIEHHKLLKKYDKERHTKFDTYAYKRLYFACIDYINNQNKNILSLDNFVYDEEGENTRYIDTIEDTDFNLENEIEQNDIILKKLGTLTELEIEIINLRFQNAMTFSSIAKELGLSEKTIRTKFKKIFSQN